ncbi:dihydroorotase [Archaeoglobus sulfaticallidus PM70-1]|uniref:Dihydroorotase n=1 Tax=Archaeoglobus sulfaticallidus PM70-1 TaxID=387631 RepID=N0BGT6_9EURY|nr:dihydroorotase [Archaeoglobus sulfaticallidus]AGK62228.1 dihydroorotase [Archaeoglobus sulfaticallidus PM70-1]
MKAISGKLFYRGEIIEAGIEIEDGRIKKIDKKIEGEKVEGLILPAGIDVHVHFRDFDEREKETIETGSLSALYGGICLVVDQPNTRPVIDNPETYFKRMEIAEKDSYIDYFLNIALTNSNADRIIDYIKEIEEKYRIPAIGEVFLQHDDENMQIGFDAIKTLRDATSKLITVHAEQPELVKGLGHELRPPEAEIKAVENCLKLGNFHFCHISTYDSAMKISDSDSTFEVAPHHFILNYEDYFKPGFMNVNPPLRSKVEAELMFNSLPVADMIASDHAPHTIEDKKHGKPGFPGVETTYPLLVSMMKKGLVSVRRVVDLIAVNPARIFGFEGYGAIEVGNYANLAVFNLKRVRKIKAEKLHTKAEWTPYENFEAIFPERVYLKGELAVDNLELLVEKGSNANPD